MANKYSRQLKRNISRMRGSLRFITNHPLTTDHKLQAIGRYLRFHLIRYLKPGLAVYPFVGEVKFYAQYGMGIIGNIFTGLEDFEEMGFLLHFLRPGEQFVDVGANVGAYSLLASGGCGSRTVAIEPIPTTYAQLLLNIQLNNLSELVAPLHCGAGSTRSRLNFTSEQGALNRVALPNGETGTVVNVPVIPLDEIEEIDNPVLVKIDVEGYEYEVIRGAARTLQNDSLSAILIELNGLGNRYGFNNQMVHEKLSCFGFLPFQYNPMTRQLTPRNNYDGQGPNTLYIRHISEVQARLMSAQKVTVLGKAF
jgi:FkbM family methyltransferase